MKMGFNMTKTIQKKRIRISSPPVPPETVKKKNPDQEKRHLELIQNLPVGAYRTTPDGVIIEANPALAKMLGYRIGVLKKINARKLYAREADRDKRLKQLNKLSKMVADCRLRRRDGKIIWIRDYSRGVVGPDGKIAFYDGILVDITREKNGEEKLKKVLVKLKVSDLERQKVIKELQTHSITDDLTGLFNRRGFFTIATEYLKLASRNKTKMFLLFLDMDLLKNINDTFGHHVGDAALIKIAEILRQTFRDSDIKGRMGGDEFTVLTIDSNLAGAEMAIGRLEKNIAEFNSANDAPFKLAFSTGVSCFDPEYPSSIEDLIVRADKLMYEKKRQRHGL
jgi:diguanylate cyclase (GGDEF)-like protein/PAS domain S-box-containing protein